MSAGKVKCQFFSVFFPTEVIYRLFQWSLRKKKQKNVSFYGVCMYVRPKLTFVSFFVHLPLSYSSKNVIQSKVLMSTIDMPLGSHLYSIFPDMKTAEGFLSLWPSNLWVPWRNWYFVSSYQKVLTGTLLPGRQNKRSTRWRFSKMNIFCI